MERWNLHEYRKFLKTGIPPGNIPDPGIKIGRVKGNKIEIDGHFFFKKEGQIYAEYKLDPLVTILNIEPKFILQEKYEFFGEKMHSVKYKSDFKIAVNGIKLPIIVEVKSVQTKNFADYSMRKRLFLKHILDNELKLHFLEITFDGNKRSHKFYKFGKKPIISPFFGGISGKEIFTRN